MFFERFKKNELDATFCASYCILFYLRNLYFIFSILNYVYELSKIILHEFIFLITCDEIEMHLVLNWTNSKFFVPIT